MSDLVNLVRLGFKQSSLSGVVVPPKVAKPGQVIPVSVKPSQRGCQFGSNQILAQHKKGLVMASIVNNEVLAKILLAECIALGNSWESPLEQVHPPIPVSKGASSLTWPVIPLMGAQQSPASTMSTAAANFAMQLPLDIDNLLTGNLLRLQRARSFIHEYDFLAFDENRLEVSIHDNIALLASHLVAWYDDPFLGTVKVETIADKEEVAKFDGMRSATIEVMMNELKEVRENQFVKLLSTIDYAWEQYGNGITD